MERSNSLVELAQRILEETEKMESSKNGECSTRALLEATQELQASLLTGPKLLEQHQVNYQSLSCLGWLVRFGIFNHIPFDFSPIAYADLATKAGVPIRRLQSVSRMAMMDGLFYEPSPAQIAHTRLSASFVADESLQDWASFITRYSAPMASKFAEATAKLLDPVAKNQTAFNLAFDTELSFFDYMEANPEMAKLFAGYMRGQNRGESERLEHLVNAFDWTGLGEANVIDVGGSTAHASIELASAFPRLHFIVQDLPEVVREGTAMLARLDNDALASRIRFIAHDFFTPQQPQDGAPAPDIYLLRKILHDWPDEQACKILQHLAVALIQGGNPRARLIIMEMILPPPGVLYRAQESALRLRDLTMAQIFNNKERELSEWEQLFSSINPRLKLKSWKQPAGSNMAAMEVVLDEKAEYYQNSVP